jgi:hemoglobin
MQKQLHKLFLLTLLILAISLSAAAQEKTGSTLYKRLGGYDAIAAMVDNFIPRIATDPMLAKFFAGHGIDSKKRLRQLVVEKICEATGGPCFYTGRTMKEAHNGLGITDEQWETSNKHFLAMLDTFQVPKQEQGELVAIITGMKGDIVTTAPTTGK